MFSAFGNFGDIKGESTEKDHKDWVSLLKVTFSLSQPPSKNQQTQGGRTQEAVEFSALHIEKFIDKATPKFFEYATTGKHIPEVTIEYSRASGDSPIVYLKVKLTDVLVSSVHHDANPDGPNSFPTEMIGLVFGTIEETYTQQTGAGGKGGNVTAKFDLTTGSK